MGDLVWRICGKKWPARHSKLSTRPPNVKLQILHPHSYYVKFGACQFGGVCLICCGVQAIFFTHIPHTKWPTAPIWNILNGKRILIKKKVIATKTKENSLAVGVLWGFEPFPHGNHHIRVYMHHVCLIQSISARKATHIKLVTCSGSSQYQLRFGIKIVLIGWSGCVWLPIVRI